MPETASPAGTPDDGPVAMRRVRFVVAYDGAGFSGFASNPEVRTVVGVLADTLELTTRHRVDIVGAGRTDAGVHGWGQVISCDVPAATDLDPLVVRINSLCAPAIVVRAAQWVSSEFSARFDAIWRHYRYTVVNAAAPNPFLARTSWHVRRPLSLEAMILACDPLIGEHDFSSFCRRPDHGEGQREPSMRRRVLLARWSDVSAEMSAFTTDQRVLRFEIRANAFCHQMVRSIVGLMVDIGTGKRHAGDVRAIMLGRDRAAASSVAPPHGLMLWEVGYPPANRDKTEI